MIQEEEEEEQRKGEEREEGVEWSASRVGQPTIGMYSTYVLFVRSRVSLEKA